jgi:hypothetical protein
MWAPTCKQEQPKNFKIYRKLMDNPIVYLILLYVE